MVAAEIAFEDASNHRRSGRFRTKLEAGVRRMGSTRVPATVTDLSTTGCRIQAEERLPIGAVIWVKLGTLAPMTAKVMWNDRLIAGCAFTDPLHPSVVQQLLASKGV